MSIFQAISDKNRRQILQIISNNIEITSTEIADRFQISPSAISQHLKILKEADLVSVETSKQKRIYKLNKESFNQLIEWVEKLTKIWSNQSIQLTNSNNDLPTGLKKAERIS